MGCGMLGAGTQGPRREIRRAMRLGAQLEKNKGISRTNVSTTCTWSHCLSESVTPGRVATYPGLWE